jgi:hypothetical protein
MVLLNSKLKICSRFAIYLYYNEDNINVLLQCEDEFVDGTFEYAPKHFMQLYTIHGLKTVIIYLWFIFFSSINAKKLIIKCEYI